MSKYNILWLDDEPIKALPTIKEANADIFFDKVDYVDTCELILSCNPEKYHAVILDANGIKSENPEIKANKSGFLSLVKLAIDKKIPVYVYSGQLDRAADGDQVDMALEVLNGYGLKEKENIFYKTDGPYTMVDKIISDLNGKYRYYLGHEYILSFFSNNWIDNKYKTEFMDPIMEYYYCKDIDSAHGNHMRNLTEKMLQKINETFSLDNKTKEKDPSRYVKIIDAIKSKELDYSKSIIGPLRHMIEITNARSHDALGREERELYFHSDFSTFFIVAQWFYKLMVNVESYEQTIPFAETVSEPNKEKSNIENKKSSRPTTHEDKRTGVIVTTYKEGGKTYTDLKVRIPPQWENYDKLLITGIKPSDKPYFGDWWPFCNEVNNSD